MEGSANDDEHRDWDVAEVSSHSGWADWGISGSSSSSREWATFLN